MKLELIRAIDLSEDEVRKLHYLSFGWDGSIMYELRDARQYRERSARVIRLTDDAGKIISWGLVRKRERVPCKTKASWDFQFYTRASHRRKGYGTIVYQKAVQVAQGRHNMIVHPHDYYSNGPANAFFDSKHFDPDGYVYTKKTKLHKDAFL